MRSSPRSIVWPPRAGYVEQDIVELQPTTPDLEAIGRKFAGEHLHTDDEVRYVLEGEGIFDIRSADDRWLRVVVEQGDLLVVPANLHHRFMLTSASLHPGACVSSKTAAAGCRTTAKAVSA